MRFLVKLLIILNVIVLFSIILIIVIGVITYDSDSQKEIGDSNDKNMPLKIIDSAVDIVHDVMDSVKEMMEEEPEIIENNSTNITPPIEEDIEILDKGEDREEDEEIENTENEIINNTNNLSSNNSSNSNNEEESGGEESNEQQNNEEEQNEEEVEEEEQNDPVTHNIEIINFNMNPNQLTIKVGDTIIWTNNDGASHTVTSDMSGELDSPLLSNGDTYTHKFDIIGIFGYHCNPHSGTMNGYEIEVMN